LKEKWDQIEEAVRGVVIRDEEKYRGTEGGRSELSAKAIFNIVREDMELQKALDEDTDKLKFLDVVTEVLRKRRRPDDTNEWTHKRWRRDAPTMRLEVANGPDEVIFKPTKRHLTRSAGYHVCDELDVRVKVGVRRNGDPLYKMMRARVEGNFVVDDSWKWQTGDPKDPTMNWEIN